MTSSPKARRMNIRQSDGKINWKAKLNPKYLDEDYNFLFATDAMTRLGI